MRAWKALRTSSERHIVFAIFVLGLLKRSKGNGADPDAGCGWDLGRASSLGHPSTSGLRPSVLVLDAGQSHGSGRAPSWSDQDPHDLASPKARKDASFSLASAGPGEPRCVSGKARFLVTSYR